jgi:tetratricopeptide (TPR) repeat protein
LVTFSETVGFSGWLHDICERQGEAASLLHVPTNEQERRGDFHPLGEILQQPSTWIKTSEQMVRLASMLARSIDGMKRITVFVATLLFLSPFSIAQVRVWRGTLTLPTYEEGAPDPNPPFDEYANNRFNYPYTLRNNVTNKRADHAWRALFLENEYLKCSVLPDIGGHLYTCTDKISGKPMFYENPSIKKAAISYRGAWAAFGVEFNFPVSHNWVTLSPVDFAIKQNDDGSASVQVGNVGRVYGMQWTVELVLRPHSTVLEERVTLNNRSDVRHRFYWWNNAGVQVWDDSRIQYPMRFAASHGFRDVQPWPVEADGTDLSIIKNHTKGPVSLFVHGSREPFMGVWNSHTNSGTVHYADYAQLPAKKIWSWGVDADGLDWRKALSDNDSAYVEVQAGLFRNQETYAFLEPRQTIAFSEYWMPVRDIGGISRANLAGVVHLSRHDNALVAALNVNEPLRGATIAVLAGDQRVFETKADLTPEHTWSHEIGNADLQQKYTLELRDAKAAVLLRHTEDKYDWTPVDQIRVGPQPSYHFPGPDERTEDDWVALGKDDELNGRLLQALQTYQDALKKFPNSFELHKAVGRLCASLLRYNEAKEHLEIVHSRDTTDAEISYYLGIALDGMGDARNARQAFESAYRSPEFRAAGALRLGELSAQEGKLNEAESYLKEAMHSAPDDMRVAEELSAVLGAYGKNEESQQIATRWAAQFPEHYFLLEQIGKPDLPHLADDAERILNIASEYMRLGLYSRALEVLSRKYPAAVPDQTEPGALSPEQHPMMAYFRGYCRAKLGQSASADFSEAAQRSTAYVFPSRAEELNVLKAALQANPQDATAHYLLGTLYFSRGITDDALAEWALARKFNPKMPVLHASMGRALLHVKKDPQDALKVLQEGLAVDPNNVELYIGIDQALSILGRPARERVNALQRYPDRETMPSALTYELILNLAEAGEYDAATALFHNRFFEREEGGTNVRQVWIEVQLQRALALAKGGKCSEAESAADHLASPVPDLVFTHDGLEPLLQSARTNYLLGILHKTCNQPAEANASFRRAAAQWDLQDAVWASRASQELPEFEQAATKQKLEAILQRTRSTSEISSHTGWWSYNAAMLDRELGDTQQAEIEFGNAFLFPDQMLTYHLTRLALEDRTR